MSTLHLGSMTVDPPVVLAPMAGITNRAFRRLCREQGAGLYVSEMVTARAYVRDDVKTAGLTSFDEDESPRSLQFYSVDPATLRIAVARVVENDLADHIDLNFGCPVKKVTRKGGGAALPWKHDLFCALIEAAVGAADGRVPITVKMRMGIDVDHLTYLKAGEAAARLGASWVALHARTAEQYYGGKADWTAIAALKEHLTPFETPVLGNGDIFSAADALTMVEQTGCDGVVIGRGCLGRPWLFGQLADAFAGRPVRPDPAVSEIVTVYRRHGELLIETFGEHTGARELRKHHAWYFKGLRVPREIRSGLGMVSNLDDVDELLSQIDVNQIPPKSIAQGPRGRTSGARPVALPQGWLDAPYLSQDDRAQLLGAELETSGG